MKVLLGIPCLLRGGTEMQSLTLVKSLLLQDHSVEIICYYEYDTFVVNEFSKEGCVVRLLKYSRSKDPFSFIKDVSRVIRSVSPDVVHVQYMTPGALAVIAARVALCKTVIATVHQPYTKAHGIKALLLLRISALLCKNFIAVSENAERSWFGTVNDITCNKKRKLPHHFTIYNAVDTGRIKKIVQKAEKSEIRNILKVNNNFVFGYVGRIRYEKGLDLLIEAFGRICEDRTGFYLIIIGEGPEKKNIEDKYSHLHWWKYVNFTGSLSWDDTIYYMSAMDIVIIPSRYEGFGLVAAEAMAASKPVIASRTGGLADVVEDEISGLLFESENVYELTDMMLRIYNDDYLRKKLSSGALKRSKDFDIIKYQKKIKELYNKLKK
jgi:glycosyltransferase involved in cell wall biosynthesis